MKPKSISPHTSVTDIDRFRLFISGVSDYAIYMLTPEGIVDSWNAGAQRFKGYTASEIIGQHFSRFYTDEDRANGMPKRALEIAVKEGKFEDEGWRVRKDGTHFWCSVVIDPIYDEAGALAGYAKVTRDITERRKAQEQLHASEEQFRLLVQGVTDYAIYMLSPAGEITNWNAGAERIKQYSHDEVIGSHFSRFYTEEDRASGQPARTLKIAVEEGRFESEGWRIRKDGSKFWAHVIVDPIRNGLGELIGFAKVTRDITERRQAAAELDRAKEALFQSQKLEAIGKLTGGVAHDFNNLLGVIVGGLELLSREARTATAIKTIDAMQRAADRGATLTQQLLSFARQQPLTREKANLGRIIGSFEAVLRRAASDLPDFRVDAAPDLRPVQIDVPQFEAALLNLVVNARDAMPRGGTLILKAENVQLGQSELDHLAAGPYIKISVTDTGTGMPPDVAARAIEPFFTTKPVGQGTGMGLSQVYGLVQQSGGDMRIESEVGKGTTISLYFPALPGSEEGEEGEDKALVVDDEPDMLDMAVALFRNMGYEVLSANNAKDALAILKRTPSIDVLFADVLMPGMSGVELARQARALAPAIKVLLASGYAAPAVLAGDDAFDTFQIVKKPYRTAEIMKMLRTLQ